MLSVYTFLTRRFNREESDAKFSAYLLTSAYLGFFLIGSICLLGIIKENELSLFLIGGGRLSVFILWVIPCIPLALRYYKYMDLSKIKSKFSMYSKLNKMLLKYTILFLLFAIPIYCFLSFRLYLME